MRVAPLAPSSGGPESEKRDRLLLAARARSSESAPPSSSLRAAAPVDLRGGLSCLLFLGGLFEAESLSPEHSLSRAARRRFSAVFDFSAAFAPPPLPRPRAGLALELELLLPERRFFLDGFFLRLPAPSRGLSRPLSLGAGRRPRPLDRERDGELDSAFLALRRRLRSSSLPGEGDLCRLSAGRCCFGERDRFDAPSRPVAICSAPTRPASSSPPCRCS